MTESVQILELLANEKAPPIERQRLQKIRADFGKDGVDKKKLRDELSRSGIAQAFRGRGRLDKWPVNVLNSIDDCFEKHFMVQEGISGWAFVQNSGKNLDAFTEYCTGVDRILATYSDTVPRYAREWFAYYSIWEVQGYAFPMPLGTSKVIRMVEGLLSVYRDGVNEVS
jgi:hypothetical protein